MPLTTGLSLNFVWLLPQPLHVLNMSHTAIFFLDYIPPRLREPILHPFHSLHPSPPSSIISIPPPTHFFLILFPQIPQFHHVAARMCSSKPKLHHQRVALAHINGRPVLQQNCNQINSCPDRRNPPPKKPSLKSPPPPREAKATVSTSPPISPKTRSLRSPPVPKKGNDLNGLSSSVDKITKTKVSPSSGMNMKRSMSRALSFPSPSETSSLKCRMASSSSEAAAGAGSIAAARKEHVAMQQEQRKMKIAHYGRVKSAKFESRVVPINPSPSTAATSNRDEKRCTFVTANSDPIFVAYHDEEWGVPVHDDRLLFELLVLTGAQVGSDWSSVLKKRQIFREAFEGFDADTVAKFNEKKITSLSVTYGIDPSLIRGAVDNSRRILEVTKEIGTFSEYLWGFVNKKPIVTQYKRCQKIPVKTSKSETISKDMVKRGFRCVGPTVIYSLMQAAGLTNDHLITCPRHLQCCSPTAAPPGLISEV